MCYEYKLNSGLGATVTVDVPRDMKIMELYGKSASCPGKRSVGDPSCYPILDISDRQYFLDLVPDVSYILVYSDFSSGPHAPVMGGSYAILCFESPPVVF